MRQLVATGLAVALLVATAAAQRGANLAGQWMPVEPSLAVAPPLSAAPTPHRYAKDVLGSLGGPITVRQDATTITIDNGIVRLDCNRDRPGVVLGPDGAQMISSPRPGVIGCILFMMESDARITKHGWMGWAEWLGGTLSAPTLVVHSPVDDPDPNLGKGVTLRLVYYLEGEQLVTERVISQAGTDLDGTRTKVRYKRAAPQPTGAELRIPNSQFPIPNFPRYV